MDFRSILLLCAVLFVCSSNGASLITVDQPGVQYVGIWSTWLFATTINTAPNNPITITIDANGAQVELSTSQLSLDANTQAASFRVRPLVAANPITLTYTINGDTDGQFGLIPVGNINSLLRPVAIETLYTSVYVNTPSEPLKITLSFPSNDDLTFTPNPSDSGISFSPSSVVISAGSLSGSFTQVTNYLANRLITVAWTISGSGTEDSYYANVTTTQFINSQARTINTPAFPVNTLIDANSTTLYVYTTDQVNSSVTITPRAVDTVFTPPTLELDPGTNVASFSYVSTSPENGKTVFYYLSGDGNTDYFTPAPTSFNIVRRPITVVTPSIYVITKKTELSIRIGAPAAADVTVSLFAANLVFNPPNVTFSGTFTSAVVDVWPTAIGPDVISYLVGGTDIDLYYTPASSSVSVVTGTFIGPSSWYIPTLWLGITSDKFPIRASVAPVNNVTLTLAAPDLIFNPPTVTFTPNTLEVYVTITPTFTNTAASSGAVSNPTINFLLGGPDYTLYSPPAPISVAVSRKSIQVRWSAHVPASVTNVLTLYLQKEYLVWVTANYVNTSDTVTVTPVSPYVTFNPQTITFTSGTLQVQLKATVTAASGAAQIDWIIGGATGGSYASIAPQQFVASIRPLSISSAVIAPDDRVAGVAILNPAAADLVTNHVYSFVLTSTVVPDSALMITPRSSHITFTPSSITLNNGQLSTVYSYKTINSGNGFLVPDVNVYANFTAAPKSAGIHEVWFDLSGPDALTYDIPDHVFLSFWLETRPPSELPPAIASASQLASSLVVFAIAMCVLVIM